MNRYELASDRMDVARKVMATTRHLLELAQLEFEAAADELSECEESPGIPLAEYRPGTCSVTLEGAGFGRVLTDADIEEWEEEAEQGYDVDDYDPGPECDDQGGMSEVYFDHPLG